MYCDSTGLSRAFASFAVHGSASVRTGEAIPPQGEALAYHCPAALLLAGLVPVRGFAD